MPFSDDLSREVIRGLTHKPKALPSKLLYDQQGSQLFQQIMELPEYYPTDCETEIFAQQSPQIVARLEQLVEGKKLQLVELGAGDGTKTRILLRALVESSMEVNYFPIDISAEANRTLAEGLSPDFPSLTIQPITGDYFQGLQQVPPEENTCRVVLFLGSNIGNFNTPNAFTFLSQLRKRLLPEDMVLIGFDLQKNPQVILDAYNDSQGITRDFNLNLLHRLNRELGANFALEHFSFFPFYDPEVGVVKSFLVSLKEQHIDFPKLQIRVHFEPFETLHTESSHKYTFKQIQHLAQTGGFQVREYFSDQRNYFSDVLWQAV